MALVSLGDMAQSFMLRSHNARLKADLLRQSQELSTGRVQDVGRRVGGDFSQLAGLERSLARIDAFSLATREATVLTEAMQGALGSISDQATSLAPNLLTAAQAGQPSHVDAIGADARGRFETALSRLNTRVGDRSLFAGTTTNAPAVADGETILGALVTATAGATTADDVAQAVSDWFDDPAGFATIGYLGGDQSLSPLTIGEGERVSIGTRADDPELRGTLKALATAALLDEGILSGDTAARAALASRAGEDLLAAQGDWSALQARLGVAQERISSAEIRNAAESSALQIARSDLLATDPYDTATALQATQTQLETLYSITARLTRLNLTDYL